MKGRTLEEDEWIQASVGKLERELADVSEELNRAREEYEDLEWQLNELDDEIAGYEAEQRRLKAEIEAWEKADGPYYRLPKEQLRLFELEAVV